ncbi:MAG: hypothetical protein ACLF0G_10450 [Candidatus Brocadiia bacterium]
MPDESADVVDRILTLEAEMARLEEARRAATGDEEAQRLGAERRSLDFEHQELLSGLTAEEEERLRRARAETKPQELEGGEP